MCQYLERNQYAISPSVINRISVCKWYHLYILFGKPRANTSKNIRIFYFALGHCVYNITYKSFRSPKHCKTVTLCALHFMLAWMEFYYTLAWALPIYSRLENCLWCFIQSLTERLTWPCGGNRAVKLFM
jgi:hypothetical protein